MTALPRVLIAALPWNLPEMLSVQVGVLKSFLASHGIGAEGRHYYKDVLCWLDQREIDIITKQLVGEDLFGALLFPEHRENILARCVETCRRELDVDSVLVRLDEFSHRVAADILELDLGLVGFTTTHTQFLSSVYISKVMKSLAGVGHAPKVTFGGLALYGNVARETLRQFPFLDYVITGEGEHSLLRLCQHLAGLIEVSDVPQLIYRSSADILENTHTETIADLNSVPPPDYEDYFSSNLTEASCAARVPLASVESVRGCKWGKCSFCVEGLPSRGGFRSKDPARVVYEVSELAARFGVLDFVFTDPDVAFSVASFEALGKLEFDLRLTAELSGLITRGDFLKLIEAGLAVAQIGAESFSSELLRKFKKGVSVTKYVEMIKLCKERGVRIVYNNIVEAPFDTQLSVDEAVQNMKRLFFLPAPRISKFRVSLGSEILQAPEKYNIAGIRPAPEIAGYPGDIAATVGPLISFNVGYGFEPTQSATIDYADFYRTLEEWREIEIAGSQMSARRGPGLIRIEQQVGDSIRSVDLTDDVEVAVYDACEVRRKTTELYRAFPQFAASQVDEAIKRLWDDHLFFVSSGECLSLASFSGGNRVGSVVTQLVPEPNYA